MKATIFKPAKNAMQSGRIGTRTWRLEFDQTAARGQDPLTGWTSSADTRQQLSLRFETREAAIAYCEKNDIEFLLKEPKTTKFRVKVYSDNFSSYTVRGPGTEPLPKPEQAKPE
jgi:hypothetical protein